MTDSPLPPLGPSIVSISKQSIAHDAAYDWLEDSPERIRAQYIKIDKTTTLTQNVLANGLQSDEFRNAVINQLTKGAAEGVVRIVPKRLVDRPEITKPEVSNFRIALHNQFEEIKGVTVSDGSFSPELTVQGQVCPLEDRVDLGAWVSRDGTDVVLSNTFGTIIGEFDQTNSDRLEKAFRTYLHFGFGAEARNLMTAFQPDSDVDPLALAISYLVDGEHPPTNSFAGLQTCDGSAAFWALASALQSRELDGLKGEAVAHTYLKLPLPLKISFAKQTVDGLLQTGDTRNAEVVRAALTRAVPEKAAIARFIEAEMALQSGKPAKAEAHLSAVSDSMIAAEALLVLIDARFQQRLRIEEKDIIAIESFAFESKGSTRELAYRRALTP
jgi:hypothetical protein